MPFRKECLFLIIMLCCACTVHSQVTIGCDSLPNPGSLLDLKQFDKSDNTTSFKGLGLSRVALVDIDNLTPCVTSQLPADRLNHIGLIVYNISITDKLCPGIYCWDGDLWQAFRRDSCFWIKASPKVISFDVGETSKTATVQWSPKKNTVTLTQKDINANGLKNLTYPLSIGPGGETLINITTSAMTAAEVSSSAFLDRETRIYATNTVNGYTKTDSIILIQKKYGFSAAPDCIYRMDGAEKSFTISTNAKWSVSVKSDPNSILKPLVKTEGEKCTAGEAFKFELVDDVTIPTIYNSSATITFHSPEGLFDDVDVVIKAASYFLVNTNLLVDYQDVSNTAMLYELAERSCKGRGMRIPSQSELSQISSYIRGTGENYNCYFHFKPAYYSSSTLTWESGGDGDGWWYRHMVYIATGKLGSAVDGYGGYYRCVKNK